MDAGRNLGARATGISTAVIVLILFTSLLGMAYAVQETSSQSDWDKGAFNATSADRNDNSGDLGLGYLNGTTPDSLKGYWRFDRSVSGTGGTVRDYSGSGDDGVAEGGVSTGVAGVFSTTSYEFDGSGTLVNTGISSIPSDTSLTVSAWVNPDGTGGRQRIFAKDKTGTPGVTILWFNDNQLEFLVRDSADTQWVRATTSIPPANEWHLVTGVWDRAAQEVKVYIDGDLKDNVSTAFTDLNSNSQNVTIGAASNNDHNWDGKIDEVRFYHEALSDRDINRFYLYGKEGVFNGDYQKTVNIPAGETPVNLTVNHTDMDASGNQSWFHLSNGDKGQTVELDPGNDVLRNYSLNFSSKGGTLDVTVNITADLPGLTPVIREFKVWTKVLSPRIRIHSPANDTIPDADPWLNVTSPDDVQTWKYSLDGAANTTFTPNETLTTVSDGFHSVKVWAESSDGFWNSTTRYFTVDTEPPLWRNQAQSNDTISATASNELRAQGYDLVELSEAILATNETGPWKNRTGFYGSPMTLGSEDTWTWSNFTWQNTSIKGERIAWKIWYRGSKGEYNATAEKSFYVESVDTVKPTITITSPRNTTISDATPWLNATSDEEISIWSYNLDAGGNQTFEPNITIGPLTDGFHNVTVWGNDTADNWASDRVYFYVDTANPRWRNLKDNVSGSVVQGALVNISSQVKDTDTGIYRALLSTNESGSWTNYTSSYGSPEKFANLTTWEIADFSWTSSTFSGRLGYRVWVRDAAGNWNRTATSSFSVSEQVEVQTGDMAGVAAWKGSFNGTSVTRQDNSGNLGIGYRNLTSDLIGLWRLDTTSGAASDYSGSGFHGTNFGAIRGVNGVFSTDAFYFGGSSDYVQASMNADPKEDWTVSAWIKPDDWGQSARQEFVSTSEDVSNKPLDFGIENGNLKHWRGDAAGEVMSYDVSTLSGWHHIAVTQDRTSSSNVDLTMYVDGVPVATDSGDYENMYDEFWIGAALVDDFHWGGKVDEVMLFNGSLSQEEINDAYFYGKDSMFNGYYNQSISVPDSGRLTRMRIDYENAATSGNKSWIRIDTTVGETQKVRLSGTRVKNYTLNFTQDGGKAFVAVNFTASTPKTTPVINSIELFSKSLSYRFNTTLKDINGQVFKGAKLRFRDQFGDIVSSADTSTENYLEDGLARGVNYTLENAAPVYSSFFRAEINDLRLDKDRKIEPQIVENYTGSIPSSLEDIKTVYAFNDSYLEYRDAKLTFPKLGIDTNSVVHCLDWDYSTATCNNWEVKPASAYGAKQNDTHIWFTVDNFDAFGVGEAKTLPNVTKMSIYDVTGLTPAEKEVGGTLVQQGLNETFDLGHQDGRQYRFQFRVENEGDGDWALLDEDELFHDGLNESWTVPKIWYNISRDYDGGSFSNGNVTWDTSSGGVLSPNGTNSTMYAKYLVNITENESRLYSQHFYINDTSESTGSEDYHLLNITKYGFLDVDLTEPPSSLTVCRNEVFTVNTTVNCKGGKCGDVSTSTRYNSSGPAADTLIPENSGTPFHVDGPNTGLCGTLGRGDSCFTSWDVNASGSLGPYSIDSNASSSLDRFTGNDSSDALLNIETALYSTFFPGEVDFGLLDPGQLDNAAPGNANHEYNLSVEGCVSNADTWIKGSELDTGGYGNYSIHENNVSYALENDISNETELTANYTQLKTSVSSGTNVTTFYWIDIPEGIKAAEYTGTLFFKVNTTE